jgi:hypothetical protein
METTGNISQNNITGRVGGKAAGYDLNLHYDPLTGLLAGRIGGAQVGKNLSLKLLNRQVHGRVGGQFEGFDVTGQAGPAFIQLRMGGALLGQNVELKLDEEVHGHVGGKRFGFDVHLHEHAESDGEHLDGRIGGQWNGKDVHLVVNTPLWVAALAAIVALKALEDDMNNDAGLAAISTPG